MWTRFRSWLSAVLHRGRLERDLADELAFHLEERAAHWRARGLPAADAMRRARLEFGAIATHTEACRESRGLRLVDELGADLRYGLRQLRRNPTFAAVAIGTLAIAVGANTAIFGLVDAILIKTLPVESPHELRQLAWTAPNDGTSIWGSIWYNGSTRETGQRGLVATSFSYPVCEALRRATSFSSVICSTALEEVNIGLGGRARLARGQLVSGNFFGSLGVRPHAGRAIQPADDRAGESPVAVLGYGFWRRELGGDLGAIGRPIVVNGLAATIVGVAPPSFLGIAPGTPTDVFLPLVPAHTVVYDIPGVLQSPRHWGFLVLGRLRPGTRDEHARQETDRLLAGELRVRPPQGAVRTPPHVALTPAGRGLDSLREQFTKPLHVLMLVVGAVLLIACANIAGLLSTRMSARQREIATRLAIGAGRWRVVRQVLTEGGLLAVAGGLMGLLLAFAIRSVLPALLGDGPDPLVLDMTPDVWLIAFAAALCASAALLCGLLPALRAPRVGLSPIIARGASTTTVPARPGAVRALVIVQVAVTVVLLTCAGLFVRTLTNLRSEQLGFKPDHLLLFEMNATLNGYDDQRLYDFYQSILGRVAALPGVSSASLSRWGLVSGSHTGDGVTVPGQEKPIHVEVHFILPGYFRTMGIPLLSGRDVTANDREGSSPVVIVNRALAARAFGRSSPLGRLLLFEETNPAIIGVAGDARFSELRDPPAPTLYVPFRQHAQHVATFALRTASDPASLVPSVEKVVSALAPDVPLANVRTQEEQIDRAVRQERLFANLVSGFAVLAALLACLGIYGTLAHSVSRRTREIGVRVALGANHAAVIWLILRESILPVIAGVGLGVLASWWATRMVASMLFGLTPHDPATYAAAAAALVASALVAAWLPSRRAARLDPMTVLRCE